MVRNALKIENLEVIFGLSHTYHTLTHMPSLLPAKLSLVFGSDDDMCSLTATWRVGACAGRVAAPAWLPSNHMFFF